MSSSLLLVLFALVALLLTSFFPLFRTTTPTEAILLRDWAVNFTRNHGWNVTLDPCLWNGMYCMANGSIIQATPKQPGVIGEIVGFDLDPTVLNKVMYGEFPDLKLWEEARNKSLAFTKLRWLTFLWFRFGPSFPSFINEYWTSYNDSDPVYPFNVLLTTRKPMAEGNAAPSAVCPLPIEFMTNMSQEKKFHPGREDVGCSNFYISSISPVIGPRTGGTEVSITVNAPLGFLNIEVGFGVNDNLTVPVPVHLLYLFDYPWKDYGNSWAGKIYSQMSLVKVYSPPHPAGPVELSIWAGSNRTSFVPDGLTPTPPVTPHVLVTPRYNFGEKYKMIFNYECPGGTFQSTENNLLTCTVCQPGEWSPIFSTACFSCIKGTYSTQNGSSSCTNCPKGFFGNVTGATSLDQCYPCDPGTYSNIEGATQCIACEEGYEQTLSGQLSCTGCLPGTYSKGTGNAVCSKCQPGSFSETLLSSICVLCSMGTIAAHPGSSKCSTCRPGQTTDGLGGSECNVTCGPGTFKSIETDRCVNCAPGRYGNTTGLASCLLCSIGDYNADMAQTQCQKCPVGQTSTYKGASSCISIKQAPKQKANDDIGLIIGIILLIIAILLIIGAIIYVVIKKRDQAKKQFEIDEIRKIMEGIGGDGQKD